MHFAKGVATLADGDVRQALNLIELATDLADGDAAQIALDETLLAELKSTGDTTFRQGW